VNPEFSQAHSRVAPWCWHYSSLGASSTGFLLTSFEERHGVTSLKICSPNYVRYRELFTRTIQQQTMNRAATLSDTYSHLGTIDVTQTCGTGSILYNERSSEINACLGEMYEDNYA